MKTITLIDGPRRTHLYGLRRQTTSSSSTITIISKQHHLVVTLCLLVLLLVFPSTNSSIVSNDSTSSIYQESYSKLPPSECFKSHRPSYFVDETVDSYRLIVNLPKTISRKNLNVDIDYDTGRIEILGWWMEHKIRGDKPKKMCLYQEWTIDTNLLEAASATSSEHHNSTVTVYDLVMEIQGHRLVLSLPSPKRYDSNNMNGDELSSSDVLSLSATNLWKKLRGLARLNTHQNSRLNAQQNATLTEMMTNVDNNNDHQMLEENETTESMVSYLQSRQDALDRFLEFSLGSSDEETYWLKRM